MKAQVLAALTLLAAVPAAALAPARDVVLPSVGHAQGLCVGDPPVCPQWRTTAWVFNPSETQSATVQVSFLRRNVENSNPLASTVVVGPLQTRELEDVVLALFAVEEYGALRFLSDLPVVVTGRIYDANVATNKGTGSAGQFFAGQQTAAAVGLGESVDLIGLAQDTAGLVRTNFGFLEATGQACTVEVRRLDGDGDPVGEAKTYSLLPWQPSQFPLTDVGSTLGSNHRLRVTVTGGSGRVIAFASRVDNRTGDPSTVEMSGAGRDGAWVGKQDKPTYDTPITLTVAGGAVTAVDATVVFTDEDVSSCTGGELARLAGQLPQPVLIDPDGGFAFSLSGTSSGVAVTLQVSATAVSSGRLAGTVTTTLSGAGNCSGTKAWPLIGARVPSS
ncbi:MAG: hypothetical protein AB1625_13615 [Acidobacteriota bacterium]